MQRKLKIVLKILRKSTKYYIIGVKRNNEGDYHEIH